DGPMELPTPVSSCGGGGIRLPGFRDAACLTYKLVQSPGAGHGHGSMYNSHTMTWLWEYGPVLLISVGALLGAASSIWAEQRSITTSDRRRRNILPAILIIVGAVLTGGGYIWMKSQQHAFEERTVSYLTGGDSYCYINFFFATSTSLEFGLKHEGENPLYDVMIEILDKSKYDEISPFKDDSSEGLVSTDVIMKLLQQTKTALPVRNVIPGALEFVWRTSLPSRDEQRYHISIFARNGYFRQNLILRRTKDGWREATQVWRSSRVAKEGKHEETLLRSFVQDGFPTGANGEIDW
ncbi:MAG: hypothetical protein V3S55_13025, partial [Nitrospiraceae bacterium]